MDAKGAGGRLSLCPTEADLPGGEHLAYTRLPLDSYLQKMTKLADLVLCFYEMPIALVNGRAKAEQKMLGTPAHSGGVLMKFYCRSDARFFTSDQIADHKIIELQPERSWPRFSKSSKEMWKK